MVIELSLFYVHFVAIRLAKVFFKSLDISNTKVEKTVDDKKNGPNNFKLTRTR